MTVPLGLPFYLLWTYRIARQRKPFLASCKLTYRCNLACQQCPFYCLPGEDPSFSQVQRTLDQLKERGSRIVIFEGGEPMLWRDGNHSIHDVVAEARRRFDCVGITTNGTIPLNVATDVLWVSIDGFRDTHNALRGAAIFDRVIENICASTHPRLYAHITINNRNWMEVPELIRQLSALVKGITVQLYYPYHHKDDLFLDFEHRKVLLDRIIQMKQHGFPVLNSIPALQAMQENHWRCDDWLIDNANPDGSLSQGCYLRGRDDIDCARCGFSPHTEASLAYQGNLRAALAGTKIFFQPAGSREPVLDIPDLKMPDAGMITIPRSLDRP